MLDLLDDVLSYFENDAKVNVELNSYNSLYKNIQALKKIGYKFLGIDKNDTFILKKDNDKNICITIPNNISFKKITMPDYKKSMVNLTSSIMKHYGKTSNYDSFKPLDDILSSNYKHVLFLILDGLGYNIIKEIMSPGDFLYDNIYTSLSAVYPSTTACAIPVASNAKLCLETGWLGWQNYIRELNRNVVLFNGNDYVTGESLGVDIRKNYLPYDDYYKSLGVKYYDLEPSFNPNGFADFNDLLKAFIKIQNSDEKTFTHAYWTEPDTTFHISGVHSSEAVSKLKAIDDSLKNILCQIGDDTLVIITADHGHQDVEAIKLYEFEDIMKMQKRLPSNEGRCLCFTIKDEYIEAFPRLFNLYFSNIYDLYTKDEFLCKGFLGDTKKYGVHPRLNDFLGDYIAVAKSSYYFEYVDDDDLVFKSTHAGLTEDEMVTPLIIYSKKR